jgi:hypothetical protein
MTPGPPKDEPRVISEWSIDTLYVHLSRIVEELDKRMTLDINSKFQLMNTALVAVEKSAANALAASAAATQKAETAMEKRFESVNEFRGAMGDQATRFITRAEVDQRMTASDKETAGVVSRLDRIEAKGLGLQAGWGLLVTFITVAGLVIFGVVMAIKK